MTDHPRSGCSISSHHSLSLWDQRIEEKILSRIELPSDRRTKVVKLLDRDDEAKKKELARTKLQRQLARIQNRYKIDDAYADDEYLQDKRQIQAEIDALAPPPNLRDYETASELLGNFPALGRGASDQTRKAMLFTMFEEIRVSGDTIKQIKPRSRYLELVSMSMRKANSGESGCCGRAERI